MIHNIIEMPQKAKNPFSRPTVSLERTTDAPMSAKKSFGFTLKMYSRRDQPIDTIKNGDPSPLPSACSHYNMINDEKDSVRSIYNLCA